VTREWEGLDQRVRLGLQDSSCRTTANSGIFDIDTIATDDTHNASQSHLLYAEFSTLLMLFGRNTATFYDKPDLRKLEARSCSECN